MSNNEDLAAAESADDSPMVPNSASTAASVSIMDEVKSYVDQKNRDMMAEIRQLFTQSISSQSSQPGRRQGVEVRAEMVTPDRGNDGQSQVPTVFSASTSQVRDEGTVARPTSPTVSLFAGRDYDQEENNDNHSLISESRDSSVDLGAKSKAGLDSDQADNDWKKLLETDMSLKSWVVQ